MSDKTNDGGSAFPVREAEWFNPDNNETHAIEQHWGLSIRDYFAGQALIGYTIDVDDEATGSVNPNYKAPGKTRTYAQEVARRCYAFADAMLAARNGGAK